MKSKHHLRKSKKSTVSDVMKAIRRQEMDYVLREILNVQVIRSSDITLLSRRAHYLHPFFLHGKAQTSGPFFESGPIEMGLIFESNHFMLDVLRI